MNPQDNNPLAVVLFAGAFILMGGFIFLAATGAIPSDPESFQAPRWVVALVGVLFMWGGIMAAFQGLNWSDSPAYRLVNNLMGWVLVLLLAIPFNWVAFGEGERHFTGGISLPFVSFGTRASETSGRAGFGCFAGVLDILLVWWLLRAVLRFFAEKDG